MCVSTSLYELVTGKMSHYIFCHVNPISVFALFNFNAMLKVETFWKTDHVNLSVIFVQNTYRLITKICDWAEYDNRL